MSRLLAGVAIFLMAGSGPLIAQTSVDQTPNIQGTWSLDSGSAVFVFAHRFELLNGGDDIISIPTFTLAAGLPFRINAGLDFTTFSEAIPDQLAGNEAQFWLKRPVTVGPVEAAGQVAYNTAAESADAALSARLSFPRVRIFGETRFFSNMFGGPDGGIAAAIGGAARLTQYLAVVGDYGRVVSEDGIPGIWSAGLALEIPASPHTLALVATNGGATTLQGASREKTLGSEEVRYGFVFRVPIGGRGRWGRVLDPVTGE